MEDKKQQNDTNRSLVSERIINFSLDSLSDKQTRLETVQALKGIKSSRVEKGLLAVLIVDTDRVVRNAASEALDVISDDEVIGFLVEVIEYFLEDGELRWFACKCLLQTNLIRFLPIFNNLVTDEFNSGGEDKVRLGVEILGPILEDKLFHLFLNHLSSPDQLERTKSISLLGLLGDLRATEPLIRVLKKSQQKRFRESAAYALGCLKDERGVGALIRALGDNIFDIRYAAVSALVLCQEKSAKIILGKAAASSGGPWRS